MIVKKAKDYYEQLYEMFPDVPKQDIRQILNYGLKVLYLHNSYGGDTLIQDKDFWCYIGNLTNDSLKHFKYYIDKMCCKFRVIYRRLKIQWDGYYYFALSDDYYEKYIDSQRHNTILTIPMVKFYKIKDENSLRNSDKKYIFRTKSIENDGFIHVEKDFLMKDVELIEKRDPLTFKDITTYNNKYEFL